jgi:ribonuclease BN (tRNA processing enzyme)
MTPTSSRRLRLTVLGCSSAAPHADWPAAGFLVDWGETTLMLDAGQGTVRRLQAIMDPTRLDALVVGHMHADHYLDLVGLRYLFPWAGPTPRRLPVHLPPGARQRLDALATAISERNGFFESAFDAVEYDPGSPLAIGPLTVRFIRGRHYVPAWGVVIEAPDGSRLAYTGDTGPSDAVVAAVRGADVLLIEAALRLPTDDDQERGHLTAEEAIDMARQADARSALIVHYPPSRRDEIETKCRAAGPWIKPAVAGLTVTIARPTAEDRAGYEARPVSSATAARDR